MSAAVRSYSDVLFCNRSGSQGPPPPEFGGGWLAGRSAWTTERSAGKLLVKHGKGVAKCITKAVSDVFRGKPSTAAACLVRAHEKAVAASARLDVSLSGFGRGTGCYEAPNDIGGLIAGVERLAGAFVPQVLCVE